MRRLALISAFLAAGWSPLVHCLATARAAEAAPSCHEEAPKPSKAPISNCAVMACCAAVLPPTAVSAAASEFFVPAFAAAAALILVAPAAPAEFAPASPPGPPGAARVASRLGRAPPAA